MGAQSMSARTFSKELWQSHRRNSCSQQSGHLVVQPCPRDSDETEHIAAPRKSRLNLTNRTNTQEKRTWNNMEVRPLIQSPQTGKTHNRFHVSAQRWLKPSRKAKNWFHKSQNTLWSGEHSEPPRQRSVLSTAGEAVFAEITHATAHMCLVHFSSCLYTYSWKAYASIHFFAFICSPYYWP